MRFFASMAIYRLLLPLLFLAAFPGWIIKMIKRGGFATRLGERLAIFTTAPDFEPCGAIHVHAISVGESLLALKLIRQWQLLDPEQRFLIATGTATGHAVSTAAAIPGLRVTYSPLDFPSMVHRYLNRFEPSQIVLIEGEIWPHLLLACRKRNIPVSLVNARMSPRSARRYQRFAPWLRPVFSLLDAVAIQEPEDTSIWQKLGVPATRIHCTGSLKFDPGGGTLPSKRPEFQTLLEFFGSARPVVLAASTHTGEDAWLATAIHQVAPHALPVIVPRHAERRAEVSHDLERAGFKVITRSNFQTPVPTDNLPHVFLIDSTGELRDWTAHADVVIIGKSFLSTGGQNPTEAILAHKPVVFGPHMENFEALVSQLIDAKACIRASDEKQLAAAIVTALDPDSAAALVRNAGQVLSRHDGATQRILNLLTQEKCP